MRLKNLIIGDIKFQMKYGFYFIYAVLVVFYICLLSIFKETWREKAATVMIFSDPAAMGMFFMGAIVLLEKSQRVLNSIAVSPVKVSEYILSKVISIGSISSIVALAIALAAGMGNYYILTLATFFGSALFTMIGLIISTKINSLNQFVIATLPFEIICFLPPIAYIFGYGNDWLLLHPGTSLICMINGDFSCILINVVVLAGWLVLLMIFTVKVVKKMFRSVGGVKL